MEKVIQERKDIAFYVILFPLAMHKDAYWKSKSIYCSKSLKMLEDAFAKKTIPQPDCDTKEIDSNIKLGEAWGISGTPTLVLPDGRIHSGTMSAKQLMDFIQGNQGNRQP
jgi:thiol:disulfide interchange protein DsbC